MLLVLKVWQQQEVKVSFENWLFAWPANLYNENYSNMSESTPVICMLCILKHPLLDGAHMSN